MSLSFDRALPGRIKKYVETHSGFVDVQFMADCLYKQYRFDYGRRKLNPFRKLVGKVYADLLKTEEIQNNLPPSSETSDDEKVLVEYKVFMQDSNTMNNSLHAIYNNVSLVKSPKPPSLSPQNYEQINQSLLPDDTKDENLTINQDSAGSNANVTQHNLVTNEDRLKENKKKLRRKRSKMEQNKKNLKKLKTDPNDSDDFHSPNKKKFSFIDSQVSFVDVAGNQDALNELARLLLHMCHPEVYSALGVSPPRGILLHGPPGCGKTLLGNAIAGQLGIPLLRLVGPELIGGVSGESEQRIRDVFEIAQQTAPCVLFLDEVDVIAQRRENSSKDMERRVVAQLLSCLDDFNKDSQQVLVVGATNRPEVLDPALRRSGRFDREIMLGIPDESAREKILKVLSQKMKLSDDVNFGLIARLTPGFVGADILSLCREAAMQTVARVLNINKTNTESNILLDWLSNRSPVTDEQLELMAIETSDFEEALCVVQPSSKREGFATVPDVTWDDVGALTDVREELSIAILGPVRNPMAFASLGLSRASGVLLAGPPGCGKTLLAKAIANESGINFISVKGPELLNMYVGESERAVRQCFERARNSAPCVVFFDELDSLCPRRTSAESGASARVVNQMLTELDGLESRKQVFVVAATNRPDIIDPAILRPGRLDKVLYVGIPTTEDRIQILRTITKNGKKPLLDEAVCLSNLGADDRCSGFTGADLSALMREASLDAIRGSVNHGWNVVLPQSDNNFHSIKITLVNINAAFKKVKPSVSEQDRLLYEEMKRKFTK
uniref:nuclear valosin-containing protein-like isoform X3 n=1 Tax=Ciona intestinalis TaxID=7719 RepID=UPI000EF4869E|nr:nuclear valosin-containing protein-like isoform X3 [Ciona intestinalis]|eukprot:XP_026693707.1 nuclear valosin-containing protein-like isoform X3 [Ciona intestinalis]